MKTRPGGAAGLSKSLRATIVLVSLGQNLRIRIASDKIGLLIYRPLTNSNLSRWLRRNPLLVYSKDIRNANLTTTPDTESANHALSFGRRLLNGTRITLGCNNVFDQDPPQAFLTGANYPDSLYDSVGRFVYVSLTKKF